MAQYAYVARTRTGRSEKGTVDAQTKEEAISILQGRDLIVVSVDAQATGPLRLGRGTGKMHRGVRSTDLIVFARSLAAMTEAGLPLLRSLETVGAQIKSQRLYNAIHEMTEEIRGGSTFRDAVSKHPTIFTQFWVSLIETGEASGQLTKALEQISIHLEKSGAIQRKVVSALVYPGILLTVAISAIFVFTIFVIPTFAKLFEGFGAKLPGLTLAVMNMSILIRKYVVLFIGCAIGLSFLFRNYVKTKAGRWQFDKVKLQLPVFGPVFQGVAAEQFASNLGTLLKAGVPILHALEIVITTCDNKVVASVIEHMRTSVREGRALAEPLGQTDIFPPMVAQMIAVGEQTGRLPAMMEEISQYYEEQVSTAVERMTALLEPIMLVGMGLVIGTLVISMYLPVFQLTQTIR